jgi:hypothetical protein
MMHGLYDELACVEFVPNPVVLKDYLRIPAY